jgi:hypothetical protein
MVLLAIAASPWLSAKWHFQLRNIAALIGLALIVMACPPFPWIIDLIFLMAFGSWLITWNTRVRHQILRRVTASVLASLVIVSSGSEWRHRSMPALSGLWHRSSCGRW